MSLMKMSLMKMSLMKVFCLCLFIMFCSAAYLPVLDLGIAGITGERGVAFAKENRSGGPDGRYKIPDGRERKKKDKDMDGKPGPFTVPEPSTLILLGAGAAGTGIFAAIKRRKK